MRGRGFAYALYVHGPFPGKPAAWSAWIADVAVNRATGDVSVTRVVAGQDSGLMINPDGVRHVAIVEVAGRRTTLLVDALLAQQDIVVKPLDTVRGARPWFSGATVLGDGSPALIVDVSSVA